jgi:hypothetical protein
MQMQYNIDLARLGNYPYYATNPDTYSRLAPTRSSKAVSNNVLYIHPLYLSFTVFSKKFHPLYLISLQQRPLNHVLYTQIPILKTFFNFIFYTYVFIILSNTLYIF